MAPFVLGRARRGVVGSSRYAERLRSAVLAAARDPQRQAVLISGEPGLEKDNLAALVHYGSAERRRLLVRLDASDLQGSTLSFTGEATDQKAQVNATLNALALQLAAPYLAQALEPTVTGQLSGDVGVLWQAPTAAAAQALRKPGLQP